MGKFDKYKKSQDQTNLDKYKKKSGSSFDEIEKTIEKSGKATSAAAAQTKGSTGGTILIIVLGIITILVWFLAINKVLG